MIYIFNQSHILQMGAKYCIQRIATDLSLKGTSILFTINKDEKFDKLTPAKMMKN